jgi:hypothetical protein
MEFKLYIEQITAIFYKCSTVDIGPAHKQTTGFCMKNPAIYNYSPSVNSTSQQSLSASTLFGIKRFPSSASLSQTALLLSGLKMTPPAQSLTSQRSSQRGTGP